MEMDGSTDISSSGSAFLSIPIELLLRIAGHLTTPELGNLRLACRGLEQSLFNSFTDEFFTRKQFMISELSLDTLIAISKSRLGWHLRHVYIGLDHFIPTQVHNESLGAEKERRYQEYFAAQQSLWNTGLAPRLLAEAFGSLQNLETVVLRDFNSRRRTRDGRHAQWRSYGSSTMMNECGVYPRPSGHDPIHLGNINYGSQVFPAVVFALGKASARPRAIEYMERHGNRTQDHAFYIPKAAECHIHPVLHSLKSLHLSIDATSVPVRTGIIDPAISNYFLRKFLACCPNLEELRINSERFNIDGYSGLPSLFRWLAAPAPSANATPNMQPPSSLSTATAAAHFDAEGLGLMPPPMALAHLTDLSLGMMALKSDEFLSVIRKFAPSLTRLELWRTSLKAPNRPSDSLNQIFEGKIIIWSRFFDKLKDIPGLNLRHLKVGILRQLIPTSTTRLYPMDVLFVAGDKSSSIKEYTGPSWQNFVEKELIPQLTSDWNKHLITLDHGMFGNIENYAVIDEEAEPNEEVGGAGEEADEEEESELDDDIYGDFFPPI